MLMTAVWLQRHEKLHGCGVGACLQRRKRLMTANGGLITEGQQLMTADGELITEAGAAYDSGR